MRTPALFLRPVWGGLLAGAVLAGCGGSSSDEPPVPPVAATTVVSGQVVKGPVDGATVCAFDLASGHKGAAIGACATSSADGAYSLSLPVGSGLVLVEATGGSFVDESTGATTALIGAPPLRVAVTANGAAVSAMATPLTTLALNAAEAAGGVTAAGFASELAAVLADFDLPATLDALGTAPDFQASDDAHAQALRVVSRMVADGVALADLLAATDAGTLAAAYAAAAQALADDGDGDGGGTPPPGGGGVASGRLAVTGGRLPAFEPQADGFEVEVETDRTTYRFRYLDVQTRSDGATLTLTRELSVAYSVDGRLLGVAYNDPQQVWDAGYQCVTTGCTGGLVRSTPQDAQHPVTLAFSGLRVGPVTLDGSLTGDAANARWRPQDLPRSTDGYVGIDGVNHEIVEGTHEAVTANGMTVRTVRFALADGAAVGITQTDGANTTGVSHVDASGNMGLCFACGTRVTPSGDGVVVDLNGVLLSNGMHLANRVFIARTGGSTTSAVIGNFAPDTDRVSALNDTLTHVFQAHGGAGTSTVTVTFRGSVGIAVGVVDGATQRMWQCWETAALGVPACSGVALGVNGRTVTFSQTPLGGASGAANIDGVLHAKAR